MSALPVLYSFRRCPYGGRAGIRVKMILKQKSSKSSSCYAPEEFGRAFSVTAKVAISAQPLYRDFQLSQERFFYLSHTDI